MTLVIVCEIHEQDDQLVHKCYDFTNPVDTKMVDKSLGRTRRHIGRCYRIGRQGGISWRRPDFTVSVKEGVVHITIEVSCYKKGSLGALEERFGGRPFSPRIGFVRDPHGFLRESYKLGKQHKVVVRYAPLPGVPEVFEIVEAYEFAYSDVKLSPSKKNSDEDDKENGKRKYKAPKSKNSFFSSSSSNITNRALTTSTSSPVQVINKIPIPKKFNKDELAKLVFTLSNAIDALQSQNVALINKVGDLENTVFELKKKIDSCPTNSSFAEIVKKGLTAPTTQVSMIRAAELAQNSETRQAAVIIRNADVSSDSKLDNDVGKQISTACNVEEQPEVFRIQLKNDVPPLLKLQFKSKNAAEKVLSSFNHVKDKVHGCRKSTARPDLSKPELAKYRAAWKEAIQKNNEAKLRIYTVRNLETVKIAYKEGTTPWPWTVKNPK